MTERVLCVVAHADDETLLCGGTLAKHVQAGDTVMVLVLCSSRGARQVLGTDVECRRQFLAALKVLGIEQNAFGNYPDQQFDTASLLQIIRDVEECVRMFEPSIVYTHWRGDVNRDHQITSEAVTVACRPVPGSSVKRLLFGEVPSSTEWGSGFEPNWFVPLSVQQFGAKHDALGEYGAEMRKAPHPRSHANIVARANWRGAAISENLAEAFVLGREIT